MTNKLNGKPDRENQLLTVSVNMELECMGAQ